MADKILKEIIDRYPRERRYALAVMQDMQRHYSYIPREGLELLAGHVGCKVAELYSMATFYKALSLKPRGKHIIKLCNGTACHIRGSVNLINGINRELGIAPGETTEDGEFTLELVNCLTGASNGRRRDILRQDDARKAPVHPGRIQKGGEVDDPHCIGMLRHRLPR